MAIPDPTQWLDQHGDYLYGYAMVRLRNPENAEDAVQETLLAALKSHETFSGRSSERTWLVGILKHKLIDQYRKTYRESPVPDAELEAFSGDEYFRDEGEWVDHWKPECAPIEWQVTPETELAQGEFWEVFDECLSPLPDRCSQAFTLREIDGLTTDEICEALGVSTSNLWVLLHRARLRLRRCIEINWFRREAAAK
ncbi:MAG TPA: sigma-70 family RNA polymerase sigma factor [Blastocatellia bacterium]|nr:sigma-70 family RNA polymerase sigma factor [Blastocatellia bacterium]